MPTADPTYNALTAHLVIGDWATPTLSPGTTAETGIQQHSLQSAQVACDDEGRMLALVGEVFALGAEAIQPLDADTLLDRYRNSAENPFTALHGRWALLVFDPGKQQILFATDRLGRLPLYYAECEGMLHVSTRLPNVMEARQPTALDRQSLYDYVYFHMIPSPGCVYYDIRKVRGGHCGTVTVNGVAVSRYWCPVFNERPARSRPAMKNLLCNTLKASVRRAAHDGEERKIGAFLSGGLDSSTVAGMLSEVQESGCDAYAIGFDAEGYDEMAFARITAQHFGIRLHEYYVTPDDVVAALPHIAAAFDEPFGNSSALPAYFCARLAASDGVSVLLAGDGGDELFAGNERYAHQKLFEHYTRIPRWVRTGMIERLAGLLGQGNRLGSKAASFLKQANTPLPDRLQYYSFLEQNAPDRVFHPDFLAAVNTQQPIALLKATYTTPERASTLNRMLFLDWQITLADNDLRKVDKACELAGIEVRYPMLDDTLVSLSMEIPSRWKLPGRSLRHFYKQTLSGWLPDATIAKSKHGFGLPFGVWMKTHAPLRDMAYDKVLKLRERSIFQSSFLEEAVARHHGGHAAYYGELVWLLAVLEIWLETHEVAA
ncbi:asparagine synthetase B [Haliea sp.]|uniref:asparagine synthetase B family protein n=1 Tax=Haliea sp. TaxID=1932666 RepID=UPI003526E7A1